MTREEARKLVDFLRNQKLSTPMLPILQSFADGQPVQWLNANGWQNPDSGGFAFCDPVTRYRIVRAPAVSKMRPWLIHEVPLEAWFRHKMVAGVNRICFADRNAVAFSDGDEVSLEHLFREWEFTSAFNPFQDDAEWLLCGKVQDA